MKDRITKVLERWYIMEPPLFQVMCCHEIAENPGMNCPVRSGHRRIEYNPAFLQEMTDDALDEALRTEAVRILLKHPYERKPEGCSQQAISIGSNIVVGDNYDYVNFHIDRPADYELKKGMPYEWYSRQIQSMLPPGSGDGQGEDGSGSDEAGSSGGDGSEGKFDDRFRSAEGRNRDLSELWDEDDLTVSLINGIIEGCTDWGTMPGELAERLKASTKARINWKNVLSGFRASILSSRRELTRMKPSRRYGFDQMGTKREYDTRLLIAVDVSGSISSESLSWFYGIVNGAFKHVASVDVVQFDCGLTVVQSLKKVMRDVTVVGRGGTSFQEPVDYAHENGYDGLLILTDGYAPEPDIPDNMRCKIIWVCQDSRSYENCHQWMEKSGRVYTIELG